MFGLNKKKPDLEQLKRDFSDGLQELKQLAANHNIPFNVRSAGAGGGYDFADQLHHIYDDFGYPDKLEFFNFWNMFRRFGVASAVCRIPVDICWSDRPTVDGGDTFNREFEQLTKQLKLWQRLRAADLRQRVGRYGGLYIRVRDGKQPEQPVDTLNGVNSVVSVTPVYEAQLRVSKSDTNPTSENVGNPITFDFQSSATGSRNEDNNVAFALHRSRVLTFAEGADDGSIYGISALENIYNDLLDLRKIAGAGGEGFYQNTRNAPIVTTKDDYEKPSADDLEAFQAELDQYLNKWRKKFMASGFEFQFPNISLDNPKEFAQVSVNNIAAGSQIPHKLIFGNQTGVKAGDSDTDHFLSLMNSRRENFCSEMIEQTIDWFVMHNVLPQPVDLTIEWNDLLARSDDDKLMMAEKMAGVNEKQFRSGGGAVFTEEQIAETAGFERETDEPDELLSDEDADGNE